LPEPAHADRGRQARHDLSMLPDGDSLTLAGKR